MPISLSSLSLRPSCTLQEILIALCALNFQPTMRNCLNLSKSLWFIFLVALKTLMPLAWSMVYVLKAFLSPLEQRPQLLKTLMLALGIPILARLFRFMEKRLTINRWSATLNILSESIDAISM
jgi:hypothetical protein